MGAIALVRCDRPIQRQRPGADETPVSPDDSIRIYPTHAKLWLVLLGAVLFVVAGVWLLGLREEPLPLRLYHGAAGVLAVVFFGACGVLALFRILRPSPAVVLSRQGITDTTNPFAVGYVSWDEVAFISIYTIQQQRMLGVFLKDAVSIMARVGGTKAGYMKANLRMGYAPVNIPQLLVRMPLEELAELIRSRYGVEKRLSPS
jgi:hypothetical protein